MSDTQRERTQCVTGVEIPFYLPIFFHLTYIAGRLSSKICSCSPSWFQRRLFRSSSPNTNCTYNTPLRLLPVLLLENTYDIVMSKHQHHPSIKSSSWITHDTVVLVITDSSYHLRKGMIKATMIFHLSTLWC